MSIQIKATVVALAASLGLLGLIFGLSPFLQPGKAADVRREEPTNTIPLRAEAGLEGQPKRGYSLFEHNCAPCHGEDARGDEGPNLHGLIKSDARIATIVKGGIKGEMPSFAKKFTDPDVQALIAYLRALED